ncbi:MAG: hypothetical protein CL832_10905 [Crocinitomicaceae bacterium]|nr:hypothetical protein [Crocinitomicaceae bacterium]|tara:strand:+ start:907 stop:2106 length:1200 start_codon:yes stop_codon:yes gene_type:complete
MSYIGTEPKDIRSFGRTKFDYTATQGQTAFTGADDDGKVLAFTVGQIEVYVNGILMDDSDFTTTGTGTVTLASAANLNDVVNVVSFETNIPDSNYVPASGGTFTGAVTHTGAFTSKGIDDNADAIAITIDASENVMIGTTTQDAPVDNGGSGVTLRPQGVMLIGGTGTSIYANREDSDGEVMQFRKDGSPKGGIGISSDGPAFGTTSQQVAFHANKLFPCQSYGSALDNTIDLGYSGSRYKDLYLSGGAYLGGTGAANKLEDYEEGTWTPVVKALSGTTQPTVTMVSGGAQNGTYTKIGRQVFVACYVGGFAVSGTTSSTLVIGGLPFATTADSTNGQQVCYYMSWARPDNVSFRPYSGTEFGFLSQNNGSVWGWELVSAAGGGNYRYITATAHYFTAA